METTQNTMTVAPANPAALSSAVTDATGLSASAAGPRPRAPAQRVGARSVAAGIFGMALVGGSVGISRALTSAPLFTAQALRYAAAGLILLAMAKAARVPLLRPRGREWLWLTGIAALGLALFNVAIVRGVAHAEPAVIAVAVACVPVVLGIVGPLLEGRAPRGRVLLAAAVVTAGSALVEGTGRTDAAGIGWAAVALVCEASFTLLAVPVLPRHGAWGVSLHSVWIGALMLAVLGLCTEGPGAAARLTASQWAAMAYLAVMVTAVAFVLWYSMVANIGAGLGGLLTGTAPISAALTGVATGGRVPGALVWCGVLTVVAGLAVGLTGPDRAGRERGTGRAPGTKQGTACPPAANETTPTRSTSA